MDLIGYRCIVLISSLILSRIFSVTFNTNRGKISAAVLIEPAIWAILTLNCNTQSQAFHKVGGIALV